MTPWLRPNGRPDFGRPVVSRGSSERTAIPRPSPMVSPSGRGSLVEVGWESRFAAAALMLGPAWEQAAEVIAAAGGRPAAVEVRPTARSDTEPRASNGTVAE